MSPSRRILAAALFLPLLLWSSDAPKADAANRLLDRQQRRLIKREAAARVAAGVSPSFCLAVVRAGGKAFKHCVGDRRLEPRQPAGPETLYNVGSVTKTFTAMLMMVLRDEGRLRLEDEVTLHLPPEVGMTRRRGVPTLYQLATHTSGIPREAPNRSKQGYSVDDLYRGLGMTSLESATGEGWRYSNLAYDLLGHLLERAAGAPYETLLRDRILSPLGMRESRIRLDAAARRRFAAHYWSEDSEPLERPPWIWTEVAGSGGLTSTVDDMARYVAFLLAPDSADGAPLRPESLAQMLGQIPDAAPGLKRQCIGWIVTHEPEREGWYVHGGEVDGHSAHVAFSPPLRVGVVVLANVGGKAASELGEWLQLTLEGDQ